MSKVLYFLKHAGIKIGLFLQSNWAYLLWGALHFTLAYFVLRQIFYEGQTALLYTSIIYGVSLAFALSPAGEWIVRSLEGGRPIQTIADKEYLLPIFEEVYGEAIEVTPSICRRIKLYISEEKTVNGFALGRNTIVLTRGAVKSLRTEELKGILAHEFGHMANGDTKASLLTIVGNGFFSVIIVCCRFIARLFEVFAVLISSGDATIAQIVGLAIRFLARLLFDYAVTMFLFLGDVILALNSRFSEYLADNYAFQIGYGEQLKDALILLNKMDMGGRMKLKELLKASHPYTTARIGRLERKLGLEVE